MALQYSTTVRNAKLDVVESTISTAPILNFFTGSPPANCSVAATGSLIAQITLPSDWMAAASAGSKAKSGTWSNTSIGGTGTIGYFRVYESSNTTAHIQGTCANSGADMNLDNNVVNAGQSVTVTTFTLNAGNA